MPTRWPSGLRRQFKALVFGRGFESHSCHSLVIAQLVERSPVEFQQPVSNTVSDWSAVRFRLARSKRSFLCGGLAQTVERCVRNAEVAGSIPASSTARSHVVQVVRIVGFHPIDPGSSPGVGVEISVSVCRRGLVGYDAAFTLLRSWVRIPPFVLHTQHSTRLSARVAQLARAWVY